MGTAFRPPQHKRVLRKLRKRVGRIFGWPTTVDELGSFDAAEPRPPKTLASRLLWAFLPRLPGTNHWARLLAPAPRKKLESLQLIRASGMFDPAWYGRNYPESTVGHWSPAEHYLELGARCGFSPARRFDSALYTILHPEIVRRRINPLAHFATAGAPLPPPVDRKAGGDLRCCVLLHLFYADLWDELAAYLSALEGTRFTLLVNIPEPAATADLRRRIARRFPDASILVSPNRGRDIGGFFHLLSSVDFAEHDIFLLAHSKRSPHCKQDMADGWRRRLLNALLGSPEILQENLGLFATYPMIGGIAAASARRTDLGRNGPMYDALLDRMAVPTSLRDCEYVTGTMLMLRSSILRRLYTSMADVQFEPGDNMPLDFHVDGQLAHAVERCMGAAVRAEGQEMAWRPVHGDFELIAPLTPIRGARKESRAASAAAA